MMTPRCGYADRRKYPFINDVMAADHTPVVSKLLVVTAAFATERGEGAICESRIGRNDDKAFACSALKRAFSVYLPVGVSSAED